MHGSLVVQDIYLHATAIFPFIQALRIHTKYTQYEKSRDQLSFAWRHLRPSLVGIGFRRVWILFPFYCTRYTSSSTREQTNEFQPLKNEKIPSFMQKQNKKWAKTGENITPRLIYLHIDLVLRQILRYRMIDTLELPCDTIGYFKIMK